MRTTHLSCLVVVALLSGCRDRARPAGTDPVVDAAPLLPPRPRHVFLIVIDTLRADHLGSFGYKRATSATLDRLAREGVSFTHAYSAASYTAESVISIFTGISAPAVENVSTRSRPVQVLFKEAGFATYSIVANPWLNSSKLFREGFEHESKFSDWEAPNTTDEVTRLSIAQIEAHARSGKPGFFYIHYLDPHDPYTASIDYGFYQGPPLQRELNYLDHFSGEFKARKAWAESQWRGMPTPLPLAPAELAQFVANYDTEIRRVDEGISELIDALEKNKMLEDSLIVLTSDHGEGFLDHGQLKHGFQLYDELVHVPLIFFAPGRLKPAVRQDLASGIDIAPTLLAFNGLSQPDYMRGFDLLKGRPKERPVPLRTHFLNQQQRGFRTLHRKFIHDEITGEKLLYALDHDPKERTPITDPQQIADADKLLHEVTSRYELQPEGPRLPEELMDQATRERLRALGYLD